MTRDEQKENLSRSSSLVPFIKIFPDAEQAYQKPEKFDYKGGKVEVETERDDYQARAERIEQRINQRVAARFFELQQNVSDNYYKNAESSDKIIPMHSFGNW